MPREQLELWSAEPHPTPQLYQQLTPRQRSNLVNHLAKLIVQLVPNLPNLPTSAETRNHER